MKLIRTIVLMLVAAGAAVVADRTYRARTNPSSAEWIEDEKFDHINIDHLQFDHEPLVSALRELSEKTGVGIVLDTHALEAHNRSADTPVTVVLDHVNLNEALLQMLRSTRSSGFVQLDFTLVRGSILVSTWNDIQSNPILRVYRIDDIIDSLDGRILPHLPPTAPGFAPSPFTPFKSRPQYEQHEFAVFHLTELIQDYVDPETWIINRGVAGDMRELNGRLFVQQTWRGHQDVARFLRELRAVLPTAAPSQRKQ